MADKEIESVKEQLKIDEGYREVIYLDSVGEKTFGIGHLVKDGDPEIHYTLGQKISKERIDQAFAADVQIAISGVQELFPDCGSWPSEVKEIMVNMMFNLGYRLKGFQKLAEAIKNRDWNRAADEMKDSKWYVQVGPRAERLIKRMRQVAKSEEIK